MMKNRPKILFLPLFAMPLFITPFLNPYIIYLLDLVCISVIIATGLNLIVGYTGQFNLGQSGFVAIGAYVTALLMTWVDISFWIALPIGGIASVLIGICLALPSLRLRGLYLALVTFAFGAITEMILIHWDSLTKGPDGLRVNSPQIGSIVLNSDLRMFYPIFIITVIMVYLSKNIINSRVGRALVSIRDSEIAAQATGVNLVTYKIIAFVLSAFYAGIAGGLYAALVRYISPDAFNPLESVIYLTMIVVGGMGSILGSIIGAIMLTLLPEILRGFKELQELLFACILILSLIFLPNGIVGFFMKFWERV
jgi:branched-chain amino acid transport system permease protein